MAVHADAGDRALAQADGRAAVAGDHAAKELEEIGVVSDDQDAFAVGILGQQKLEAGVIRAWSQRFADFDLGFVAELGADKLRGLQGAFEGAGDDDIHLHLERAQDTRHQHALFFSLLDEAPLGVESGVLAAESGVGVAHEVKDHRDRSAGRVNCGSVRSVRLNINTTVTIGARSEDG